jgi:hypothetical protein
MATERVIDLANRRYADVAYEGPVVLSGAAEEQARAERQQLALSRLRKRVRAKPGTRGVFLGLPDLTDLLIVLGLDDW